MRILKQIDNLGKNEQKSLIYTFFKGLFFEHKYDT